MGVIWLMGLRVKKLVPGKGREVRWVLVWRSKLVRRETQVDQHETLERGSWGVNIHVGLSAEFAEEREGGTIGAVGKRPRHLRRRSTKMAPNDALSFAPLLVDDGEVW